MISFIKHWQDLRRLRKLPPNERSIVFYAEDFGSWQYLRAIISELVDSRGERICYVTSSVEDPILSSADDRIEKFCIGFGAARTVFFQFLEADVLVMTMPDLDVYHLKRSKHPVHYIYVYHSMVSSHMIYRQHAFDHFDSILCVGPYHKQEIRAQENLYSLAPKQLVESGYSLLDEILSKTQRRIDINNEEVPSQITVLIAPSWGEYDLLENHGEVLIQALLQAGYEVIVRPHPMTKKQRPTVVDNLENLFSFSAHFRLELELSSQGEVDNSDILISDWSGSALEYAFGLERPVIYIDTPRKINNKDYDSIPFDPVEVALRSQLGSVVSVDDILTVPELVEQLCKQSNDYRDRIQLIRDQYIYNVGSSASVSAGYIANVVHNV